MKIKNRLFKTAFCVCAALLLGVNVFAQQAVKGTLRSATGEPIAGATITVKGTNRSVVTDVNGNFTIEASQGSILTVSSVGFEEKEVKVNSETVTLEMETKNNALSEVVVTGYTAQKKESPTG